MGCGGPPDNNRTTEPTAVQGPVQTQTPAKASPHVIKLDRAARKAQSLYDKARTTNAPAAQVAQLRAEHVAVAAQKTAHTAISTAAQVAGRGTSKAAITTEVQKAEAAVSRARDKGVKGKDLKDLQRQMSQLTKEAKGRSKMLDDREREERARASPMKSDKYPKVDGDRYTYSGYAYDKPTGELVTEVYVGPDGMPTTTYPHVHVIFKDPSATDPSSYVVVDGSPGPLRGLGSDYHFGRTPLPGTASGQEVNAAVARLLSDPRIHGL